MSQTITFALLATTLLMRSVNAQIEGWRGNFGNSGNRGPGWWNNGDNGGDDGDGSSSTGITGENSLFSSQTEFNKATRILIIHAVLASLVWVIFIPSLAILLRLNIKNPVILKIHAVGQIISYIIYIVAAGMGFWLAQQSAAYGVWNDPHPKLGLAVLAIAFFQPIFGAIHHRIYKKRAVNAQAGRSTEAPGRTSVGHAHLWLGRLLIVLGVINGGLGIRLASFSPFQTGATTNKARITYTTMAAVMFVLYMIFLILFEVRRTRHQNVKLENRSSSTIPKDPLPTYDESEESVGRNARYT
ncbi:hypothetical protein A1O3_08332 [Capronia epimyces CBS 606.96]|uniref:Cytochrome b561 domain-containing protein n=1 Tax=Capronia epimyces CBS 606.96 TaxID=1182542 RepID=W9XSS8_9EURO|nr:uncharacterized protein A1O3_08332 [Capronia epimyces CBS 606.96]EXJ80046.1 hypothetical protein A1O3_08332 [Capronia epimyces CBS 606.96]